MSDSKREDIEIERVPVVVGGSFAVAAVCPDLAVHFVQQHRPSERFATPAVLEDWDRAPR